MSLTNQSNNLQSKKPENKPTNPQEKNSKLGSVDSIHSEQSEENAEEAKDSESNESIEEEDYVKEPIEEVEDDFQEDEPEEKIQNEEENKHLQEELDKANNLVDYFLTIGLEPNIYLNKWLYENDVNTLNTKYIKRMQPKITSSFPHFEKTTIAFDDSIISHCFTNGFQLVKSSTKPKNLMFSFILDNNYFNLNYPQKYLTCLLFYENICEYRFLYEQDKNLLNEIKSNPNIVNEVYASNNVPNKDEIKKMVKDPEIYIPKCLLVMSLYPYFGEFEKILTEIYSYSLGLVNEEETRDENMDNIFMNNLSGVNLRKSTYSKQAFPKKERNKILTDLFIPIDKLIENILIELPVPPRGVSSVSYYLNNEWRIVMQTVMNKLPLMNLNIKKLFMDYEVKDIILMYNYIFLEGRILFFSKNIDVLNLYIYGLLSFLYPFQYQYQVVTILPEQNFEIIESITPFIAGINQPYESDFFEKKNFTLSDSILVIDIDNYKYEVCNEQSPLPEFPSSIRKNLEKKLNEVVGKILQKEIKLKKKYKDGGDFYDDSTNNPLYNNFNVDYYFNYEIQEAFFNFNAKLLANYSKYLNLEFYSSNIMPCLDILFKVEDYLKEVPSIDKDFYEKFVSETQIFGDFLFLRMIPKNSKEKMRILLFDERINENSTGIFSKPPPMVFTNSKDYDIVDKFELQRPRRIKVSEIQYYSKIKNRKLLLHYGVVVTNNKGKGKTQFNYPIFPKLTTKIFFQQNIKDYYAPNNWNDTLNCINEELISKSHLGNVSIRNNDMKNYIYLCWTQMFAMTFWYCEEYEKKYRFQEFIKIFEETNCYEMELFNLLFETLSTYGKDYMVLKLYDALLKLHLNPSLKVHTIVMKIIDKQKMEGNFNEKLQKFIENESKTIYKKSKLTKREFRSKYNDKILTEDITFYAFDTCIVCQKDIDLELISKNFKEMSRDLIWVKCPGCGNLILPKLSLQFGRELNKSGLMRTNTCMYNSIVLFSPYILKNNYNSSLVKIFGNKLDVEELMMKYPNIFWDSLWYFKLNGLEYDFMLPYPKNLHDIITKKQNLEISIKGSMELNNNNESESDEEQPQFNYFEMKICNGVNNFMIEKVKK